jgi:hypothetical protein
MKYYLALFIVINQFVFFSQVNFQLNNAVVIGQFDKPEDRFSIEITTTEILASQGIKAIPSLNLLKAGADSRLLSTDSIKAVVRAKGFDTYLIVKVIGYDKRFKASERKISFEEALGLGTLFNLYRDEAESISFEFSFFRNDQIVYREVIRCLSIADRNSVLKKYRKKLTKRVSKKWRAQ